MNPNPGINYHKNSSTHELLLDDNRNFVMKAKEQDIDVTFEIWDCLRSTK